MPAQVGLARDNRPPAAPYQKPVPGHNCNSFICNPALKPFQLAGMSCFWKSNNPPLLLPGRCHKDFPSELLQSGHNEQGVDFAAGTVNVVPAIGCDQDVANALDAGGIARPQLPHKCPTAADEIETIDVGRETITALRLMLTLYFPTPNEEAATL